MAARWHISILTGISRAPTVVRSLMLIAETGSKPHNSVTPCVELLDVKETSDRFGRLIKLCGEFGCIAEVVRHKPHAIALHSVKEIACVVRALRGWPDSYQREHSKRATRVLADEVKLFNVKPS